MPPVRFACVAAQRGALYVARVVSEANADPLTPDFAQRAERVPQPTLD